MKILQAFILAAGFLALPSLAGCGPDNSVTKPANATDTPPPVGPSQVGGASPKGTVPDGASQPQSLSRPRS